MARISTVAVSKAPATVPPEKLPAASRYVLFLALTHLATLRRSGRAAEDVAAELLAESRVNTRPLPDRMYLAEVLDDIVRQLRAK